MRITVITVCRNAVDVIDKTVRSVLSQTYRELEYIVVDGDSTDGTLDRLRGYGDLIAHILSEPDTGVYNAMNKALRLVTGDIIVFLNAGDCFASMRVAASVMKAFSNDPDVKLVYGDLLAVFPNGAKLSIKQPGQVTRWKLWLRGLCHQTVFARRELFESLGCFDEGLPICADWDWTLRAVIISGVKAVHLPIRICDYSMGGLSANQEALRHDKRELHRRYYSRMERCFFSLLEAVYKVGARVHIQNYSPPWIIRRVFKR